MTQRVLVVDDEPFILRSLSFVLQRGGFEVLQARDGDEALEALRDHRPQVCLLDVMMPRRSGYEVCEIVKGDPDLRDTHVIMLTAKGQEVARERGLAAGCDEYLTKPFSPSLIVERVKAAFEARAAASEAPADADATAADETASTVPSTTGEDA